MPFRRTASSFLAILTLATSPALAQTAPKAAPRVSAKEAARKRAEEERLASEAARKRAEEERAAAEEARRSAEAEARALREELQALEKRVADLEAQSSERQQRIKALEETTSKLPEADAVVSVGTFPGSFRIPGTDAALKIGGQVRVTMVESFDPIGSSDRFITSSIPVAGTAQAGAGSRLTLIAIPSRFNLDFRTPTGIGDMRAFIEADFAGPNNTLRLRHAFGRWGGFLFGQTWSTFADPGAEPDGIDFEGLNAISLFRQVQVRYTRPLSSTVALAVALENPKPEVTGAAGVTQVPDLVLRVRWEPSMELPGYMGLRKLGHVQLALVLRQIRAEPEVPPPATVTDVGFGAGLSGRLNTGWVRENDDLTFSAYFGKGLGRYITDLDSFGGQDAYYDPATARFEALQVAAGYLGYELAWTAALRSTVTVGWVRVWTLDVQPANALEQTLRMSVNLAWSPVPRLDFVGELLGGRRWDKDGAWGQALQLQVGTRFVF